MERGVVPALQHKWSRKKGDIDPVIIDRMYAVLYRLEEGATIAPAARALTINPATVRADCSRLVGLLKDVWLDARHDPEWAPMVKRQYRIVVAALGWHRGELPEAI